MTLRHLLVYLDHAPASEAKLHAALSLAREVGAQVTALCLIAEPFLRGAAGHHLPAELVREHVAHADAEAAAILDAALAAAGRLGVAMETVRESGSLDRLPLPLARRARPTDLLLLRHPHPAARRAHDTALVAAAFVDNGHPRSEDRRAGQ